MLDLAKYICSVPHRSVEVLASTNAKAQVFWDVAPFSLVEA
jgi:hypothetical protein